MCAEDAGFVHFGEGKAEGGDLTGPCTFLGMGNAEGGAELFWWLTPPAWQCLRGIWKKLQGQPQKGQAAELDDVCSFLLTEISCHILYTCKLLHIFAYIFQTVANTA